MPPPSQPPPQVLKDLAVNSPVLLRQQPRGEVRVSAVAEPTTTGYRVELMVEEAVHLVAPATLIDIAMVTSDGKHAMHYTAEFNASRNPRHEHVATRSVHKSSVEGASVTIRFYSSSFTEPTLGTVAFSLADVLSDDVTTAGWFHLLPEPAALTQHFRCSSIPGPSKCTPTLVRERLNSIQRRVSGVHVPAPRSLLDVTLSRTLGCGSYGKVILATDDRGNQFAIKGLSKAATIAHDDVQQVLVERQVLTQFRHPTIARLFSTFDTDNFLYFCLEPLLGGSLADIAVEGVELPPAAVAFFGGEILLGLWWLHDSGAIHRDMKLDNVLIDDAGHLRLADFGLAKILPWDTHTTRTFCGTPEYVAPEMLAGGAYGRSVDYWALGVLLYRLRIGAFPFPRGTDDDPEVIYRATSAKAPVMVPKGVDSACAHAIQGLLTRSVKNRLGCDMYRGGEDLRAAPLFASIDWSELARRETPVPLRVEVEDAQGPPRDTSEGDVVGETMFMLDPTAEYDLADGDNDPFDGFTWSQNHELLELLGLRLSLHPKKFLAGGASPKPERGTCKTTIIT
jgi:serine/threonine protein kinase